MLTINLLLILCLFHNVKGAVDECQLCSKMAQYVRTFQGQSYSQVYQAANSSLKFFNTDDQQFLTLVLQNTRDKTIIVLHDTETRSLQETIAALEDEGLSVTYIVDIDGQVYQYVRDSRRAWHAGSGIWRGDGCDVSDTNTRSVGIETVNSGDESFPPQQILGIYRLIDYLRTKWHVDPWNIIAHHENGPDYKYDISGYFEWRGLYEDLGLWKDLWTSKMSYENQSKVLLSATIKDDNLKTHVQQLLYNHGYGTVNVGDPYDSTTKGKVTTAMAIQSFNRKFCPEIFLIEKMRNGDQILDKRNQQVYGLTLERLQWFSDNQVQEDCVNY